MANESSLRSYRDFDAYDHSASAQDTAPRDAAPRASDGDPLAELARIIGRDDAYADLLKSVARTRGEPQPSAGAAGYPGETLDIPAMALRGGGDDGSEIDWDELEAELVAYQSADQDPSEGRSLAEGELRGSHGAWDGGEAAAAALERLLSEELRSPAGEDGRHLPDLDYAARAGGGLASRGQTEPGSLHAAEAGGYAHDAASGFAPHEAPPRSRRAGVTAVAAVLGLAVLGGGGVLAYRSVSGNVATGEPRLVRANPEPVRVAVQQAQDPKPITDRVAGGERVVPREERPVSTREQAAQVQPPPAPSRVIPLVPGPAAPLGVVTDPGQPPVRAVQAAPVPVSSAPVPAFPAAAQPAPPMAPVPAARPSEEPRRVRTVQVAPDGSIIGPPAARPAPAPAANPLSVAPAAAARRSEPPPALAAAETRVAPAPAPRPSAPVRLARTEPADETRPGRSATPLDLGPQRTASVRTGGAASTFVQISSHQSDAEARSAFAAAQRRFPMLQGQTPNIRTAEIAGRGTWHRLRVGPFSREEAQSFCQRLKAAGGSCVLN